MDQFEPPLPPEIWERVLDNLTDFKDCKNATKAVQLWYDILYPSRSSWVFGQVIPLLFEHLSKQDILYCRLVCKRWQYAVDYFLSNNIHQQPFLKDTHTGTIRMKNCNFDDPLNPLVMQLYYKGLLHRNFSDPTSIQTMLLKPISHTHSPFIGGSVRINESATSALPKLNRQLLEKFGMHIRYIVIDIRNYTEIDGLARIFELITLLPNLRKLEIMGEFARPNSCKDLTISSDQLAKILESRLPAGFAKYLPKIESLYIDISGIYNIIFQQTIIALVCSRNLKSLKLRNMALPSCINVENLVDLNLNCASDKELSSLLALKCPLEQLYLVLNSVADAGILFNVLSHFSDSLKYLGLKFEKANISVSDMPQVDLMHSLDDVKLKESYYSNHALLTLQNIKTFSLEGLLPSSLNFILSMCHSLEYMYVDLQRFRHRRVMGSPSKQDKNNSNEELDLLEHFERLPSSQKFILYKSNVWQKFKKLKVLSVNIYRPYVKEEYRRHVFEKL